MPRTPESVEPFDYTVETSRPFEDAVAAVEEATARHGFRVLHTHDVGGMLAEKGFAREPIKIVEICNARYASEVLAKNVKVALMLPCPISIYREGGVTHLSTMLPEAIARFYPAADIEAAAAEVQKAVLAIVNEAKG